MKNILCWLLTPRSNTPRQTLLLTVSIATVITLSLITPQIASAQWEWLYPKPQGNNLYDIFFLDDTYGWSAGWVGTVARTTDGGITWRAKQVLPDQNLTDILFTDRQNGWLISNGWFFRSEGTLYKSTDGGEEWEEVELPESYKPMEVFFRDPNNGWLVGDGSRLLKTTDGGKEWSVVETNARSPLYAIYALDSQKIWAVGDSVGIVFSPNGGKTWIQQSLVRNGTRLNKVYMLDSQYGWAVGSRYSSGFEYGIVYGTTDGGFTWNEQYSEYNTSYIEWFSDVYFKNRDTGWVVGALLTVNQTTNGGKTWKRLHHDDFPSLSRFFNPKYGCNGMHFVGNKGWVASDLGIIFTIEPGEDSVLITTASQHIVPVDTSIIFNSVRFYDAMNGVVLGRKPYENYRLYRTSDGGITLTEVDLRDTTFQLHNLFSLDRQHLWVAGAGRCGRSTDGGVTWNYAETVSKAQIDLFFSDQSHGWGLASSIPSNDTSVVIRTTDGGATWDSVATLHTITTSLFFLDERRGWVTAHRDWVYMTQDGGVTWDSIRITPDGKDEVGPFKIYFADELHGWIVGGPRLIMWTEDGGKSWNNATISPETYQIINLYDVTFIDRWRGWAVGIYGTVLSTTDGGKNWDLHDYFTHMALWGVHFTSQNQGWIVGENGMLVTTQNNGGLSSVAERIGYADKESPLSIYPSVAQEELKVSYAVEKDQQVTIYLADNLGRRLQTVMHTYQQEGQYALRVDLKGLPAGNYYVVMLCDGNPIQAQPFICK
ncbi:MAG: hypothetical protein KDD67_14845 [Ignavibacteriae bacterium]|nr:hypothetical protein [Ignavibacteriota bacterium]MCB9215112.1 hypothetical protein [Ignavibacteria bacterium]